MRIFWTVVFIGFNLGGVSWAEGPAARTAEFANQSKQVEAINAALSRRQKIFVDAWDQAKAAGKLNVSVKDVPSKIRKPILDATNGSIDPKELDTLVSRIESGLADALKAGAAASWVEDYATLKVTGFIDLADPALAADLDSVVDYFRKEYDQDVTPARLVFVTGLPLGELGKHLGRNNDGASAELGLTIGASLNLSALVETGNLSSVLDPLYLQIFGAKDVLLVDSEVFKKLRPDSLNIIAHELRHMLDHNSNDPSRIHFFENRAKLEKELEAKKATMILAEQAAIKESPETIKHLAFFAAQLQQKGAGAAEISTELNAEL